MIHKKASFFLLVLSLALLLKWPSGDAAKPTDASTDETPADIESKMTASIAALILVTDGVEDLETVATIDILSRAGIGYSLISLKDKKGTPVKFAHGLSVNPDATIHEVSHVAYDIIILPGGSQAAREFGSNQHVQKLLQNFIDAKKWIAAICAAPTALVGLLPSTTRITAYPTLSAELKKNFAFEEHKKVVVDGKIITSEGPGTAIDFALEIVSLLKNREVALKVSREILHVV